MIYGYVLITTNELNELETSMKRLRSKIDIPEENIYSDTNMEKGVLVDIFNKCNFSDYYAAGEYIKRQKGFYAMYEKLQKGDILIVDTMGEITEFTLVTNTLKVLYDIGVNVLALDNITKNNICIGECVEEKSKPQALEFGSSERRMSNNLSEEIKAKEAINRNHEEVLKDNFMNAFKVFVSELGIDDQTKEFLKSKVTSDGRYVDVGKESFGLTGNMNEDILNVIGIFLEDEDLYAELPEVSYSIKKHEIYISSKK